VAVPGARGQHGGVNATVRSPDARDHELVVALSLRAWAPVFASLERALGPSGVYAQLHPDWRVTQRRAVEAALGADEMQVWVADVDGVVAGFVAAVLHHDENLGEVHMLAVDPAHQRRGVGTALLTAATDWITAQGRVVALVGTGGDPGHAPARALYERAGFTALPVVNYFRTL
jgi:GNAT superfamily N-acetyltransferase